MRKSYLILVFALLVAACGGDSSADTTNATDNPSDVTSTAAAVTTTTEETTTTTTAASGGGGQNPECLVGTWNLDSDAFFDSIFEAFPLEDQGFSVESIEGRGVSSIELDADGSMVTEREDWGFEVVSGEGTFIIAINGTQTGTWEADSSILMITIDGEDSLTVEASAFVNGQELPLPAAPMDVPTDTMSGAGQYDCSDDTLAVTVDGVTSTFERQ